MMNDYNIITRINSNDKTIIDIETGVSNHPPGRLVID